MMQKYLHLIACSSVICIFYHPYKNHITLELKPPIGTFYLGGYRESSWRSPNYFVSFSHKITGAAGHASLVRKLTSLRRSISVESDEGHFLTPPSPKQNTPERGVFCFDDGRLPGIEPGQPVPQTGALTITP